MYGGEGNMNEWIRHLYSALLCIVVHPKRFTIIWGGLSSTTTSVQHPLGWCDGSHSTTAPVRSPHTSYRWRGERDRANQVVGVIGRPWLTRASGGNLSRTPGLHPYSFTMSVMGFFNDHRESGPRFNVSSERRCSFDSIVSPSLYLGIRTHTDHRASTLCRPH